MSDLVLTCLRRNSPVFGSCTPARLVSKPSAIVLGPVLRGVFPAGLWAVEQSFSLSFAVRALFCAIHIDPAVGRFVGLTASQTGHLSREVVVDRGDNIGEQARGRSSLMGYSSYVLALGPRAPVALVFHVTCGVGNVGGQGRKLQARSAVRSNREQLQAGTLNCRELVKGGSPPFFEGQLFGFVDKLVIFDL